MEECGGGSSKGDDGGVTSATEIAARSRASAASCSVLHASYKRELRAMNRFQLAGEVDVRNEGTLHRATWPFLEACDRAWAFHVSDGGGEKLDPQRTTFSPLFASPSWPSVLLVRLRSGPHGPGPAGNRAVKACTWVSGVRYI